MRYDELLKAVLSSTPDDWSLIHPPAGPQYVGQVSADGQHWLEVIEHRSHWILRDNVQIGIAYGMPTSVFDDNLQFDWPAFPDPVIKGEFADILYNGQPVHRAYMISVDGGRATLPSPDNEIIHSGQNRPERFAYSATQSEVAFARLIDQLGGKREFENYLERAGIVIIPDPA